jgi:hypothetical protein
MYCRIYELLETIVRIVLHITVNNFLYSEKVTVQSEQLPLSLYFIFYILYFIFYICADKPCILTNGDLRQRE